MRAISRLEPSLRVAALLKLVKVTAGDPALFYDGSQIRPKIPEHVKGLEKSNIIAIWYFITDQGVYMMGQTKDKAVMFEKKTGKKIMEVDV